MIYPVLPIALENLPKKWSGPPPVPPHTNITLWPHHHTLVIKPPPPPPTFRPTAPLNYAKAPCAIWWVCAGATGLQRTAGSRQWRPGHVNLSKFVSLSKFVDLTVSIAYQHLPHLGNRLLLSLQTPVHLLLDDFPPQEGLVHLLNGFRAF